MMMMMMLIFMALFVGCSFSECYYDDDYYGDYYDVDSGYYYDDDGASYGDYYYYNDEVHDGDDGDYYYYGGDEAGDYYGDDYDGDYYGDYYGDYHADDYYGDYYYGDYYYGDYDGDYYDDYEDYGGRHVFTASSNEDSSEEADFYDSECVVSNCFGALDDCVADQSCIDGAEEIGELCSTQDPTENTVLCMENVFASGSAGGSAVSDACDGGQGCIASLHALGQCAVDHDCHHGGAAASFLRKSLRKLRSKRLKKRQSQKLSTLRRRRKKKNKMVKPSISIRSRSKMQLKPKKRMRLKQSGGRQRIRRRRRRNAVKPRRLTRSSNLRKRRNKNRLVLRKRKRTNSNLVNRNRRKLTEEYHGDDGGDDYYNDGFSTQCHCQCGDGGYHYHDEYHGDEYHGDEYHGDEGGDDELPSCIHDHCSEQVTNCMNDDGCIGAVESVEGHCQSYAEDAFGQCIEDIFSSEETVSSLCGGDESCSTTFHALGSCAVDHGCHQEEHVKSLVQAIKAMVKRKKMRTARLRKQRLNRIRRRRQSGSRARPNRRKLSEEHEHDGDEYHGGYSTQCQCQCWQDQHHHDGGDHYHGDEHYHDDHDHDEEGMPPCIEDNCYGQVMDCVNEESCMAAIESVEGHCQSYNDDFTQCLEDIVGSEDTISSLCGGDEACSSMFGALGHCVVDHGCHHGVESLYKLMVKSMLKRRSSAKSRLNRSNLRKRSRRRAPIRPRSAVRLQRRPRISRRRRARFGN